MVSLQPQTLEQIDNLICHPIGKTLILNIREGADAGHTVTPGGRAALVEELHLRARSGEALDDALSELFRIADYFVRECGTEGVMDACCAVVASLAERLRDASAQASPADTATRKERVRQFLGNPPAHEIGAAGVTDGVKPWERHRLRHGVDGSSE